MRRLAALLVAATAATGTASSALAAEGTLTPSGRPEFPQRSFVLTLPEGTDAASGAVSVTEDGSEVLGLRVEPLGSRFGVMLAIDASASMKGAPLRGALAAARAFADQRPASQPLGVLTFNETTSVIVPPTTDAAVIERALAERPPLAPATRLYDAVKVSAETLRDADYEGGAVVVLSDGNDFGSTATAEAVGRQARRNGIRVVTVGVQSRDFDPSSLEELALAGGGEYAGAASSADLASLYRGLSERLADAYVVRYRSTAPAGADVQVAAQAGDVRASATYEAPRLRVAGAVGKAARPPAAVQDEVFAATGAGRLLITLAIAVLTVVGVLALLHQRRRATAFRDRVAEYGGSAIQADGIDAPHMPVGPDTRIERGPRLTRLADALELGRVDVSPERFVAIAAGLTFLAMLILWLLGGVLFALLGGVAGALAARGYVRRQIARLRREFADQLADTVSAVASAMRTGHSFAGGLAQAVEHAPEPTASELQRVVAADRLGVPIEQALAEVSARMNSRDVGQVGLVAVLQRETGGNGAEALDRVVENVRARDDLRRLLRTLTAQGKIAQRVLTGLPIAVLALASLISADQFRPLFNTTAGHIALGLSAALVVAGGLWIKKIVDLEV